LRWPWQATHRGVAAGCTARSGRRTSPRRVPLGRKGAAVPSERRHVGSHGDRRKHRPQGRRRLAPVRSFFIPPFSFFSKIFIPTFFSIFCLVHNFSSKSLFMFFQLFYKNFCSRSLFFKNFFDKLFKMFVSIWFSKIFVQNFVIKLCFGSFSQECFFFKIFLSKYYPKTVHKRNFQKILL
jgi:hypothetical protein